MVEYLYVFYDLYIITIKYRLPFILILIRNSIVKHEGLSRSVS